MHLADGSDASGVCAVFGRARHRPVEGLLLRCPTHGGLGNFEEMLVRNIGAIETLVANAHEQCKDAMTGNEAFGCAL